MVSAPARRIAALYAIERGLSQRQACALMQTARSSLFYIPSLPIKNAPVVSAMRRLSGQYPRYGSRRIRVFLGREGISVGSDDWSEKTSQVKYLPSFEELQADFDEWRAYCNNARASGQDVLRAPPNANSIGWKGGVAR